MTNICGLCILTRKHGKTVQVQRQDGKILEFTSPILVEEVLQKFPGSAGVGLSDHHHPPLPLKYKLKLGNMYYLVHKSTSTPNYKDDDDQGSSKRIKVVITKQQLQQLVSSQISLQDILLQNDAPDKEKQYWRWRWRPHLHSIPEGDE